MPDQGIRTVYLKIDHWNDFSFVTMFYLSLHDDQGQLHDIGNIKIGFRGQDTSKSTYEMLGNDFEFLPEGYFSLGTDVDYYRQLADVPKNFREDLLGSLNDMVFEPSHMNVAQGENVFRTSLLRDVSLSVIKGQFTRVLGGHLPLTDFKISYRRPDEERMAGIELDFSVKAGSKPSTNIHALIGRNGVGKTTLLNGMIEAITNIGKSSGQFFDIEGWQRPPIAEDYFSSLVSVSFSAFDPFKPPSEQPDPSKGACYFYIGLKNTDGDDRHTLKGLPDLRIEFVDALKSCFSQRGRRNRWESAICALESDENFAEMQLLRLVQYTGVELEEKALALIKRMSSGHAIVLLTVTKLVARVEEKTLVLIDEPESHLHPPLLSAFIRSLSELLHDRNGVAIIATHSPVVLQEMPKTCVWKINRVRLEIASSRPEEETFGENVGTLTREIFGLEVVKSGFHTLLMESVAKGGSYEDSLNEYSHQLGFEARAILKALVMHRDRKGR
ncbi:MAG: ATP-binding protein, partial [Candidatus Heimdallarchaeota archaeon]|nr:ATP-binding protein [Candidatus Heimdallarchaeota archaeon]